MKRVVARVVLVACLSLSLSIFTFGVSHAGWLDDAVKSVGESAGQRALGEAASVAYDGAKSAAKDAVTGTDKPAEDQPAPDITQGTGSAPEIKPPAAVPTAVTLPPPMSPQGPLWRSFVNLQPHRLSEEFTDFTASFIFPLRTFSQSPLTLQQAIANARARLSRDASASAIAGLGNSPDARSAGSLQGAAVAAIIAGKPAAALAALLTAYDKEPRNPSVLVNLAGLLARMGMPSEALALLDAADKLGASFPAPVGLKGQAIALNNRGYALLLLSRWKEAEAALRKAVALEPQLSEAARNLAYVLNQEDEKEEAKKFFLLGVWRVQPRTLVCGGSSGKSGDPPSDPFKSGTNSLPALGEIFDLSNGVPGRLPIIRHPTDLAQMEAFKKMVEKYRILVNARMNKRSQRMDEISALQRQRTQRPLSLMERRSRAINGALGMVGVQPDVRALYLQENEASAELRRKAFEIESSVHLQKKAIEKRFNEQWRGKSPPPSAYAAKAQQIVALGTEGITRVTPAWNHYEEILRKRLALKRRYMSAIVTQLGDPLWHERGTLSTLQDVEMYFGSWLLDSIHTPFWQVSHECTGSLKQQQPIEDDGEFSEEDIPSCTGSATIEMSFGNTAEVSLNCKSIEIEVGTESWLGPFASAEFEFQGRVTVFAGPRAELGIKGLGSQASVKNGLYIMMDREGVQDVGVRWSAETNTMIVPGVSVQTDVGRYDFSFMEMSFVPSV